MPHKDITEAETTPVLRLVPKPTSTAHQLERAVIAAEFRYAAIARGMRELRDADAIDADHAIQFGDLLTDLELATSLLVAARANAVAS